MICSHNRQENQNEKRFQFQTHRDLRLDDDEPWQCQEETGSQAHLGADYGLVGEDLRQITANLMGEQVQKRKICSKCKQTK